MPTRNNGNFKQADEVHWSFLYYVSTGLLAKKKISFQDSLIEKKIQGSGFAVDRK